MLKAQLFSLYVFFHTVLCGCVQDRGRADFELADDQYFITKIGKIKKEGITESSGFAWSADSNLWTHNDGGGSSNLFKVTLDGELVQTLAISHTTNRDWEDLAKDKSGNIYIGDFGNNQNKRHDLRIFRVNENDFNKVDTIRFRYANQQEFPPAKEDRNFDCEAFFWYNHNLYLFSKDRGRENLVNVYKVPETPGNYVAEIVDHLPMGTMITAADISPDQKHFALLGYGKIYLFETGPGDKLFDGKKYCIPLGKTGQAEALVFDGNSDLIISNENGKIFRIVKK
jgi:hypothetical protein